MGEQWEEFTAERRKINRQERQGRQEERPGQIPNVEHRTANVQHRTTPPGSGGAWEPPFIGLRAGPVVRPAGGLRGRASIVNFSRGPAWLAGKGAVRPRSSEGAARSRGGHPSVRRNPQIPQITTIEPRDSEPTRVVPLDIHHSLFGIRYWAPCQVGRARGALGTACISNGDHGLLGFRTAC